jgi:hypothetical protein
LGNEPTGQIATGVPAALTWQIVVFARIFLSVILGALGMNCRARRFLPHQYRRLGKKKPAAVSRGRFAFQAMCGTQLMKPEAPA